MTKFSALFALFACSCAPAGAADWLNYGGDPQRTGWQKREKDLKAGNIAELRLLWKLKLDNRSKGLNSLTAPTILGPIFTHRGIKELVFVAGASDNIYAVDADLGRIFWKRHINSAAPSDRNSKWPCGSGLTAAPVVAPAPSARDDDEASTPQRPLYFVSSDGRLNTSRPADGVDIAIPVKFIPANANSASLNLVANSIYTTTSDGCGGAPNGVWGMEVNSRDAKASFFPSNDIRVPANVGVSAGSDGTIYSAFAGTILSLTPANLKLKSYFTPPEREVNVTPVAFTWKGRELIAGAGKQGRVFLLDAGRPDGDTQRRALFSTGVTGTGFTGSLATWEDASGTRWIYAATHGSIMAFKVAGTDTQPELAPVWSSRDLAAPVSPVVVNGIVFALASGEFTGPAKTVQEALSKSTHATLYALDAATGKELYSSGDAVKSFTHSSGLAVANGHVCFGTWDNTLYCFGFPIEI